MLMLTDMDRIIKNIVRKKQVCYFISPHLDDAVLSCAGLIGALRKSRVEVVVINVFTAGRMHMQTLSALAFLRQCQAADVESLFQNRINEDRLVFKRLGIKVINLSYIDCLWRLLPRPGILQRIIGRLIPEVLHIYPTFRWHARTGFVSSADSQLQKNLKRKLNIIIPPGSVVFSPLAVGNHVDHVIVRNACRDNFPTTISWVDFPYSLNCSYNHPEDIRLVGEITADVAFKKTLIRGYKTQVDALFPDGSIPNPPEKYYQAAVQS